MYWRFGIWLFICGLLVSSLATPARAVQDIVLTIVPAKTSMCSGSGSTNTITAHVMTADNQPVINQTVVFTILYGTGTITPTVNQTGLDGSASTTYRAAENASLRGLVVIAASVTDGTGVHRVATTIFVQQTDMVAETLTVLSDPGPAVAGDLTTLQLTLAKQGAGTPAISLLRLTKSPMLSACGILPLRTHSIVPASSYTIAHVDSTNGIDSVDLTFAYTDPGKPVGLHWWNEQISRWQLVNNVSVNPTSNTVQLHVTSTTTPSLANLATTNPFFVVVPLNQQWLPLVTRAAGAIP